MTEISGCGRIALDRTRVVLLPTELGLRPLDVDASVWATAADRPELADGRVLSVFDYQEDWAWWERHPDGDELAYVLAGEIELLLDDGDVEWSVQLSTGAAAIVPRGTWHSARVPKPGRVLFVTPCPARTEHRDAGSPPRV